MTTLGERLLAADDDVFDAVRIALTDLHLRLFDHAELVRGVVRVMQKEPQLLYNVGVMG